MKSYYNRSKSLVAGLIFGICLLSFPTTAQQGGPRSKTISDDDFVKLHEQIRELKNPTFRAFLRIRLLSWESASSGSARRQAAMEVAAQGVTDLCEHQDEVWPPTALWLYGSFVKQIKTLQSPDDTASDICTFKAESKSNPARDFSSGIRMLSNPETSAAGIDLAKAAILSGQVSAATMLGQLITLLKANSPQFPELLNTVLVLEEKQPGTLTLRLMPFFSAMFLDPSVSTDVQTRFLSAAVRSTQLSAEELANPVTRTSVIELLNSIINPAQQLAPALYPEIASRLSSLSRNALNRNEMRLAAEERIQKATDPLEQLLTEANSASDEQLKKYFFLRAARGAKEQGQWTKAVDLATKVANDNELNDLLSEIVPLATKKKAPDDAAYAISKMTKPLAKTKALRLLGDHYGENQDKVKSKDAFAQAGKNLESVDNDIEKVRTFLSLAESVLKYEPADAYEVFRASVKAINTLPSPQKDDEKMFYVTLLPVADDLIRSFGLLATRENQTATSLATEIKLPELRLSALSGAYSSRK